MLLSLDVLWQEVDFWQNYVSLDVSIYVFRLKPKTNLESMALGFIYILAQCTL